MTDFLYELSHSWGNTPKQKAREKEYNHEYYLKNKEKWQDNRPLAREKNVTNDGKGVVKGDVAPSKNVGKNNKNDRSYDNPGVTITGSDGQTITISSTVQNLTPEQQYEMAIQAISAADMTMHALKDYYKKNYSTKVKEVTKIIDPVSSWKIGASEIADTYKVGLNAIKSLFIK